MNKKALFFAITLFSCVWAFGQTSSTSSSSNAASDPNMKSTHFDMTGFPQWSKDLRRGEIIAFGSFPFVYFFTTFFYDTYRSASRGWDARYAPWPIKGAGAIGMTQEEQFRTLWIAAGASVSVALIDYFIARYKRNKAAKEIMNLPGTPVISRRPLDSLSKTEAENADAAGEEAAESAAVREMASPSEAGIPAEVPLPEEGAVP